MKFAMPDSHAGHRGLCLMLIIWLESKTMTLFDFLGWQLLFIGNQTGAVFRSCWWIKPDTAHYHTV